MALLSKRGGVAALLLLVMLVPGVVGCSGPADDGTTPATAKASATTTATEPALRPIETATPVAFDRGATNAKVRNEIGEPWRLDAAGATACARAEFAFRSPETDGDLAAQLKQLRLAVRTTRSTALRAAVTALPAGAAADDVRSVLEICTELGYQL